MRIKHYSVNDEILTGEMSKDPQIETKFTFKIIL